MRVCDDDGNTKGWRPLGGGTEVGEPAEAAVARELREELGLEVARARFLGVLENIYEHHGVTGHELVMAYDVTLAAPPADAPLEFFDGTIRIEVRWIPLAAFRSGREVLMPPALLAYLAPTDGS